MNHHARGLPRQRRRPPHGARALLLATTTGLLAAPWGALPARAQSTDAGNDRVQIGSSLSEVLVTAEKRRSTAQKTAASITVRSGEELRKNGQYSLSQILEGIPGVQGGASAGVGGSGSDVSGGGVFIRGVQPNAGFGPTSGIPTTALYTDGIYEGIGSSYDIARVEVLRGPQGTLYGRSATAGVVATYTRDPQPGRLGADETVEIGNYGLVHYNGAVNLPLVGSALTLRLAGNHYQRDGYISRAGGAQSTDDWRAKLLYQPSPDFSALIGAAQEFNITHSGGTNVSLSGPDTFVYTTGQPIGTGHTHFNQLWGNVNWTLGPLTLTWLPAIRTWHQNALIYTSGSQVAEQIVRTPYDQFITQELRLASNGMPALSFQTGVFGYANKVKAISEIAWYPSGAAVNLSNEAKLTEDLGVFGEATYNATARLRLTGGLRYDYTEVRHGEIQSNNVNAGNGTRGTLDYGYPVVFTSLDLTEQAGTREWTNLTFKARGEYDLTPRNLLYASVSSGYLPGSVDVSTNQQNQLAVQEYNEETLTAYEIGSKNRFLNNALQVNADLYYYDYGGYQTTVTTNATTLASAIIAIPAKVKGGELEVTWRATALDTLGVSAGYVYGTLEHIPTGYSENVAQNYLTGIVPLTVTPSVSHVFRLHDNSEINLHLDATFTGPYNEAGTSPTVEQLGLNDYVHLGDEILGNASLSWNSVDGRYSLDVFVRNMANNRYKTEGGVVYIASPMGATISGNGTPYDPRTYGVNEHISF